MKNKNSIIGLFVAGAIICISISSCSKNLDLNDPNSVTTDRYFKNSEELLKGTNAVYASVHGWALVAREWFFLHDTRSDEMSQGGGGLELDRSQLLNGATSPTNGVLHRVWTGLYTTIHRANTVIENAAVVSDNAPLRDRCVGEAKLWRAWAYFELVSMWGAAPLYTSTVKSPSEFQPRASTEDIYAVIIKDLQDAASVLPSKSGYPASELGRVTNAGANALLGRVLMQKGDYAGAKTALLKIQSTGADGYSLTSRYLDNFEEETEFNSESVLELVYHDRGNNDFNWGNILGDGPTAAQTTIHNQEYSPIAWRNLIPSNKILNEFENTATGADKTDPRFSFSVYKSGDVYNNGLSILTDNDQSGNSSIINGVTVKASWRKHQLMYKDNSTYHPGGINERLVRYAEVLLMLAECENEAGNIGTATTGAIGYLNQVRNRPSVAMPNYPTTQYPCGTKDQVTRALMHEKSVEMAAECVRNIDIIRWRERGYFSGADPLSYFRPNRDELLPIPQQEIDNNPRLGDGGIPRQNPGY